MAICLRRLNNGEVSVIIKEVTTGLSDRQAPLSFNYFSYIFVCFRLMFLASAIIFSCKDM